jgi:uncharacterized protein YbcV (DUF1398 family)
VNGNVDGIAWECTRGSDEGRLSFPEVVRKLAEAGVERYHTDLVRAEKVYYQPKGDYCVTACAAIKEEPAGEFSAAGVEMAIRAVQRGAIQYIEFCRNILAAGCVGYIVSLTGRRVVYYGRTGDTHIEPFPPKA